MSSLTNYKGLNIITPDPTGTGGLWLNNNMKTLADNAAGYANKSDLIEFMMITSPDISKATDYAIFPLENLTNIEYESTASWLNPYGSGDRTSLMSVDFDNSSNDDYKAVNGSIFANAFGNNAASLNAPALNSSMVDYPLTISLNEGSFQFNKVAYFSWSSGWPSGYNPPVFGIFQTNGQDDILWQGSTDGGSTWVDITAEGISNVSYVVYTEADDPEITTKYGTAPSRNQMSYLLLIWDVTNLNAYTDVRLTAKTDASHWPNSTNHDIHEVIFNVLNTPLLNTSNNYGRYLTSSNTNEPFEFETVTQTATTAPSSITINTVIEDSTATINTDLVISVSRDGGTTYTTTTMVYERDYSTDIELYTGTVEVSGQPSGTDIKVKVESKNITGDHEVKIHGLSVSWS